MNLLKLQKAIEKTTNNDPRRLMASLEQARIEAQDGQLHLTRQITSEVIRRCDPDESIYQNTYAKALLILAECHATLRNIEEAEVAFSEAIQYREQVYGAISMEVGIVLSQYVEFLTKAGLQEKANEVAQRMSTIVSHLRGE